MKPLLNTLFVNQDEAYLAADGRLWSFMRRMSRDCRF